MLIATVLLDSVPAAGTELGVFADGECRAAGMTDSNGNIMLMIPGDMLTMTLDFKLAVKSKVLESANELIYENDAIVGTPDMPYEIRFDSGSGTGLYNPAADGNCQQTGTYDVLGRRMPDNAILPQGVYIINGRKVVR